jgi:hypothetical protein
MDPYIEILERWPDFHHDFLVRCRDQLNERLPDEYAATLGERIELIDQEAFRLKWRGIGPDVTVVHDPAWRRDGMARPSSPAVTLEPHTLPNDVRLVDLPTQLYVEITHLPDQKVITDIELLSPTNKRAGSRDRIAYLAKRQNLLLHEINLVEFDLLLRGERIPMPVALPPGDYHGFITRGSTLDESDVYSWSLRDPLPTLPIPLRPKDADAVIDLAAAFAQTYEHGRYGRLLRYDTAPTLLAASDRAWAVAIVAAAIPR